MFGRMTGICGPMHPQEQLLSCSCAVQKSECDAPGTVTGFEDLLPSSVSRRAITILNIFLSSLMEIPDNKHFCNYIGDIY